MIVVGQYRSVLVDTCWYWVNMERYWLIMLVLGQWSVVPVGTLWYWVRRWRYWLIHDGTGSVWGATCWYLVALVQYKAVLGQYEAVRAQSIWV